MRTLAVLSCKGGTGKTTVSVHLAAAAAKSGRRTVIADTDPQNSSMEWRRVRKGPDPEVRPLNAGALFTFQRSSSAAGAELVVIDTRAAAGDDGAEAARCADLCLIVVRPSFLDIKAVARSVQTVMNLGKPGLIVVNQAPLGRDGKMHGETAQLLRDLGLPLSAPVLKSRAAYQAAVACGMTVDEFAPAGPAAEEIEALWQVVEARLWPTQMLLDLDRREAMPLRRAG